MTTKAMIRFSLTPILIILCMGACPEPKIMILSAEAAGVPAFINKVTFNLHYSQMLLHPCLSLCSQRILAAPGHLLCCKQHSPCQASVSIATLFLIQPIHGLLPYRRAKSPSKSAVLPICRKNPLRTKLLRTNVQDSCLDGCKPPRKVNCVCAREGALG